MYENLVPADIVEQTRISEPKLGGIHGGSDKRIRNAL